MCVCRLVTLAWLKTSQRMATTNRGAGRFPWSGRPPKLFSTRDAQLPAMCGALGCCSTRCGRSAFLLSGRPPQQTWYSYTTLRRATVCLHIQEPPERSTNWWYSAGEYKELYIYSHNIAKWCQYPSYFCIIFLAGILRQSIVQRFIRCIRPCVSRTCSCWCGQKRTYVCLPQPISWELTPPIHSTSTQTYRENTLLSE